MLGEGPGLQDGPRGSEEKRWQRSGAEKAEPRHSVTSAGSRVRHSVTSAGSCATCVGGDTTESCVTGAASGPFPAALHQVPSTRDRRAPPPLASRPSTGSEFVTQLHRAGDLCGYLRPAKLSGRQLHGLQV